MIVIYPQFLKHCFIKRSQAQSFKTDRESVESLSKACLIHFDFPENYTCEAQNEVQGAHWNQLQVSAPDLLLKVRKYIFEVRDSKIFCLQIGLFSVVMYHGKSTVKKVMVSNSIDHTKTTIGAYLYMLLSSIPETVEVVKLWSDGPVTQFKNKFKAALIMKFEEMFRFKIVWNFFASAHGKGAVDGIGAVAKNKVRRMVTTRKAIVNCASDLIVAFHQGDQI